MKQSTDAVGPVFGAAIVAVKELYTAFITDSSIDIMVILDTILLSAVGALVGFLVTELARYVKSKIIKR